jgi:hypothetical protein
MDAHGDRLELMTETSSDARLRAAIHAGRRRIAAGNRPLYHATWTTTRDGAPIVDVMIRELPIIHLFVPDYARVSDGARILIGRTLAVDPTTFDVVVEESSISN